MWRPSHEEREIDASFRRHNWACGHLFVGASATVVGSFGRAREVAWEIGRIGEENPVVLVWEIGGQARNLSVSSARGSLPGCRAISIVCEEANEHSAAVAGVNIVGEVTVAVDLERARCGLGGEAACASAGGTVAVTGFDFGSAPGCSLEECTSLCRLVAGRLCLGPCGRSICHLVLAVCKALLLSVRRDDSFRPLQSTRHRDGRRDLAAADDLGEDLVVLDCHTSVAKGRPSGMLPPSTRVTITHVKNTPSH